MSSPRAHGFDAPLTRRGFLGRAAALAGGLGALSACSNGDYADVSGAPPARTNGAPVPSSAAPLPPPTPAGRLVPGAVEGRVLVVVDLLGGNDGLSTLVPLDSGRLHDLRPGLMIESESLLPVDAEMGFHPALARLHARGLATVEGVGPIGGDLSHFAMTDRWQRGDVTGAAGVKSGFLGRLCDALAVDDRLVGLSLAGSVPTLTSGGSGQTIALPSLDELDLFIHDWDEASLFADGLTRFTGNDEPSGVVTHSYEQLRDLAHLMGRDARDDDGWGAYDDGGELGEQLHAAARMIAADTGVRVIYTATGDYDTHDAHRWRQESNLAELDAAVSGFLTHLDDEGLADQVLVATMSEFGRRVPENADGLDHGSASTMLLAGAIPARQFGDRPPLDDLDGDDNLRVTVGFDRYMASLAEEWLGVEAVSVLPDEPEPLGIMT